MKPAVILSIVTAALVVLVFLSQLDRVSPGPIHSVHARLAGFDASNCEGCHGANDAPMSTACTACHTRIADQRDQRRGLHGRLTDAQFEACGWCHTDHLGDAAPLVTAVSFARAGFESVNEYRAAHDAFPLIGAHADAACVDCHPHAEADSVPSGAQRFFLAASDAGGTPARRFAGSCASCHHDPHPERHGQSFGTDCASCHDDSRHFTFDVERWHDRWLPLNAPAHASLECAACHAPSSDHAVLGLRRAAARKSNRSCADCHSNPHVAGVGRSDDAPIAIANSDDCARCHTPDRFANASFDAAAHAARGVPLLGAHARLVETEGGCETCHTAWAISPDAKTAAPRMDECRACHADPHSNPAPGGLEFDLGTRSCAECHEPERFTPALVNAADHARFGFALSGHHQTLECAACHNDSLDAGAPASEAECEACHASPHLAFNPLAAVDGSSSPTGPHSRCAPCHATTDASFHYPDSRFPAELHARTGFALEPPHTLAAGTLECASCHAGLGEPDTSGHVVVSFAERYPGREPQRCETCHGDPHPDLTHPTLANAPCLSCHDASRFVPTHFTPEDHAATRFPLEGAHAALPCRSCHTSDPEDGTLQFGDLSRDCRSCHDDAHFGTFADRSCDECHSTATFARTTRWNDHNTRTKFALVGRHAEIECAACHTPTEPRKRLDPSCQSCHGDPHFGQFERACSHCHDPEGSFRLTSFDHKTHSRFELDARHAQLSCDRCHRAVTRATGETYVRYRPLGTECRDCHGSPSPGGSSR